MGSSSESLRDALSQQDDQAVRLAVNELRPADLADYVHHDGLSGQGILELLDPVRGKPRPSGRGRIARTA
ncbi:hypothetical protein [Stutzerimonas tarimensis]|uniref:Magnesium transporter n=1 Tax=Stutzerimonas tarimensis TaxID=1507735 RepID=A0ABV7T092_9GAMM